MANIIITDPNIMLGKRVIKNTRITVELLQQKITDGYTILELLEMYPHLSKESVLAAMRYVNSKI